ncbi:Vitamin B12 import ATP-binding protein BtuD [Streptomyces alboniger]
MYRIPDARYRENLDRCVELLQLGELLDVPVRQLSLGQRMRGDIAAALLHDPEVLYLDEPTIGLDVVSKAKVRGFLRDLNAERGTTVLLTTHDLQDIEQLCSRVMVIDHGRLMYDGPLDGLHEAGRLERTLVVDLERELPPMKAPRSPRGWCGWRGPGSGWRSRRRRRRPGWWRRSRPGIRWWTCRCGSRTSSRSSRRCTRNARARSAGRGDLVGCCT